MRQAGSAPLIMAMSLERRQGVSVRAALSAAAEPDDGGSAQFRRWRRPTDDDQAASASGVGAGTRDRRKPPFLWYPDGVTADRMES